MGSMSAAVFIGHFNGDINPTYFIEVIESDSLALQVHALRPGQKKHLWRMVDPDRCFDTVLAIIALTDPELAEHPLNARTTIDASRVDASVLEELVEHARKISVGVSVTLSPGSSLRREDFETINNLDVNVFEQTYARQYNRWYDRVDLVRRSVTENSAAAQ
ncbi:MAG: hypothetical protein WCJ82_06760 [Actinomycetota bacterium]|jgi:hypothetical protein